MKKHKHKWIYVGTEPFKEPTYVCLECGITKVIREVAVA